MARTVKQKPKEPSPESREDEILTEPADSIDPYAVLSIDKQATQDQIKSAYRKAALRYHPDKAKPEEKDEANKKFQELATAYAILSDEKRRRRYDATGNTAESLDDDDFDWTEFFREQSAAMVNADMIDQIRREYQGSEEEREDVLQIYEEGEGNMDLLYETVMCSNVLEDDERFRTYIDKGIKDGTVKKYARYAQESKQDKKARIKKARGEEQEAMELAEELGIKDKLFGAGEKQSKGRKKTDDNGNHDSLQALIQQRQKDRSSNFFDRLEEKYGGSKKSKRKPQDEPPEEMFRVNAKKSKSRK